MKDLDKYPNSKFDNFNYIPTVKYRHHLNAVCEDLPKIGGIKYYCLCLSIGYRDPFYLSNMIDWAIPYRTNGFVKCDTSANPATDGKDYFIRKLCPMNKLEQVLYNMHEKFGIYETYSIIRQCADVKITAIAKHDSPVENPLETMIQTVKDFENFTEFFIRQNLEIILENCSWLYNTPFSKDCEYRKAIIKREESFAFPSLSNREKQVLFYAFHGFSAKETAKQLLLEFRTVEKYIDSAKSKLDAKNIVHAINLALRYNLMDIKFTK